MTTSSEMMNHHVGGNGNDNDDAAVVAVTVTSSPTTATTTSSEGGGDGATTAMMVDNEVEEEELLQQRGSTSLSSSSPSSLPLHVDQQQQQERGSSSSSSSSSIQAPSSLCVPLTGTGTEILTSSSAASPPCTAGASNAASASVPSSSKEGEAEESKKVAATGGATGGATDTSTINVQPSPYRYPPELISTLLAIDYNDDNTFRKVYPSFAAVPPPPQQQQQRRRREEGDEDNNDDEKKMAATTTAVSAPPPPPLDIPKHILGYSTNFLYVHKKLKEYSDMDEARKQQERDRWDRELADWEKELYTNQANEIMIQRQFLLLSSSIPSQINSTSNCASTTACSISEPLVDLENESTSGNSNEAVANFQQRDAGISVETKLAAKSDSHHSRGTKKNRKRSRDHSEHTPSRTSKKHRRYLHHSHHRHSSSSGRHHHHHHHEHLFRNTNIPQLPTSIWVDHILPYINDRQAWNNMSRACKDIYQQSKMGGYNHGGIMHDTTSAVAIGSGCAAATPTSAYASAIMASPPSVASYGCNPLPDYHHESKKLPPPWPKTVLGPSSNNGGCVTFSYTGRFLAYPTPTGDVEVYDRHYGKCVTLHQADEASNQPSIIMSSLSPSVMPLSLSSCCFSPVEDLLACTYRRFIFVWDLSPLNDSGGRSGSTTATSQSDNHGIAAGQNHIDRDDDNKENSTDENNDWCATSATSDASGDSGDEMDAYHANDDNGVRTYHALCRKHTTSSKTRMLNGKKKSSASNDDDYVTLSYRIFKDTMPANVETNNRKARPTCLAFSPDGLLLTGVFRVHAFGGNNLNDAFHLHSHSALHFYDTKKGIVIRRIRLVGTIGPIKFSPNGCTLAAGSSFMTRAVRGGVPPGARIFIVEAAATDSAGTRPRNNNNGEIIRDDNAETEETANSGDIASVALSSMLLSSTSDDVSIFSTRCLSTAGRTLTDLAYSNDGKWLASSYSDGCIKVTSAIEKNYRKSKKFRLRRRNHSDMIMPSAITSIAFCTNDSNYLVCGYADGTIYARNANERRLVELHSESFRVPIDCIAISPDGWTIASVPRGGLVRLLTPL